MKRERFGQAKDVSDMTSSDLGRKEGARLVEGER